MAQTDPTKGMHFSEGKPGVDQIPPEVLLELGKVYSYGEGKYGRDNWKKGMPKWELYGSCLRHLYYWALGEKLDPESKLPHIVHAAWNAVALTYYDMHGLGELESVKNQDELAKQVEGIEAKIVDALKRASYKS